MEKSDDLVSNIASHGHNEMTICIHLDKELDLPDTTNQFYFFYVNPSCSARELTCISKAYTGWSFIDCYMRAKQLTYVFVTQECMWSI